MSTPTRTVRVLVVDDSAVIRQMLCDLIGQTPGFEVVGAASDGARALEMLDPLQPDVVTLDIQMPNLDGLATLDAILSKRPVPVIMVSALTQLGATITLEALERGAIDYVAKPERGAQLQETLGDELVRKIRMAAGLDARRILEIRQQRKQRREQRARMPARAPKAAEIESGQLCNACVAIGISTGGPPALTALFEAIRPPIPPIVVVQHMPQQFTKPLAWRLDSISELSIKEAEPGDRLRPNHVLIAPGGRHLELRRRGNWVEAVVSDGSPVSGHKPSVDVMMRSAAVAFGPRVLGVVMTGMGRDGSDGCAAIRRAGGYVLGQDEATSEVYGMNKVAFREGNVDRQFALDDVAAEITCQVQRMATEGLIAAG